jgi:hypothetical protein
MRAAVALGCAPPPPPASPRCHLAKVVRMDAKHWHPETTVVCTTPLGPVVLEKQRSTAFASSEVGGRSHKESLFERQGTL